MPRTDTPSETPDRRAFLWHMIADLRERRVAKICWSPVTGYPPAERWMREQAKANRARIRAWLWEDRIPAEIEPTTCHFCGNGQPCDCHIALSD